MKTKWWLLQFETFPLDSSWVDEKFFNSNVWSVTLESDMLLIDREQYQKYENSLQRVVKVASKAAKKAQVKGG